MGVPMIKVGAEIIAEFWPDVSVDEDDYIRRSNEELELADTYREAADELKETKAALEEDSSGETTKATSEKISETVDNLIKDAEKSEASAGNLAFRGQSMFNLKNILNSIAWGFHDFVGKIIGFFFGDPVGAAAAKEAAEMEAKAAGGMAKFADDLTGDVTTDNVSKGLDIADNLPDAHAPMIEDMSAGDNNSAKMEGQELYDNKGNLLGTLGKDGSLVPADPAMQPQPGGAGQPQPGGMGQPQPQPQPGMGQPQPGMGQPQPGMGQPMQPGMGQPMQPQPQPQQPPYYGPVYDQNGQVMNQLQPQQLFNQGQGGQDMGYTPQGWGPMEGMQPEHQNVVKAAQDSNMMNPSNYGYNGTPQGAMDSLVQAGQQMANSGVPGVPKDLIDRFTSSLSQLSDSAAQLVGISHELFGVEPPSSEDLGEGDQPQVEDKAGQAGGAGGGMPAGQPGNQQDGDGGASAQDAPEEEDTTMDETAPEEVGHVNEPAPESDSIPDPEPVDKAEDTPEPEPAPEPEPEPEPEPVVEDAATTKAAPASSSPLFKGWLNIDTPLFSLHSGAEIGGTHLTSGAAVPALAGATAFAPTAPVAPAAGGFGGAGFGAAGFGAGMTPRTSPVEQAPRPQGRVGVGSTAYDAEAEQKSRINGGHGAAEVAEVVRRNNADATHEMSGYPGEDEKIVPVVKETVDDSALSMLPPLTARGARVLAAVLSETTARQMNTPVAVAVYSDGGAIFTTADGMGATVSARPMAAVPLMDELARLSADGSLPARQFISDWTGMDDPVAVLALAIEVGVIDTPQVLVTTQEAADDRELPVDAQALTPQVLARIPAAQLDVADEETLGFDEVAMILAPTMEAWQFPETGVSARDLSVALASRRWSTQDDGTALVATIWWMIARCRDALNTGDMATATRLAMMVAGLPEARR